ncbi:hypothetical protein ABT173_28635 [Streptomyces sp. NPDC001795]|uniref:hypothetical protein n=1 Tax=Streptomyces sp. NPDC001795 TaxID=3154525 RepID=UPI00331DFDD3
MTAAWIIGGLGMVGVIVAAIVTGLFGLLNHGDGKNSTSPAIPSVASTTGPGNSEKILADPEIVGGHHPNSDVDEGYPAGSSPCRKDAQQASGKTGVVADGESVGSAVLYKSPGCGMMWVEVRDLKIDRGGTALRLDIFGTGADAASEFGSFELPDGGSSGTIAGLMIAEKTNACVYAKVYVGNPGKGEVAQTARVCA